MQHATRAIPTAALRSKSSQLHKCNTHCAASSVQCATRLHAKSNNMQCATSECNMDPPTGRDDRCHATCNLQPCNTKMQQVRTPCNIKHTCIVRSTRCNMHHTPCNVQRTPCTVLMQHAQLSATRIAHRKRACDAAALELD